ncbi:MAG TPA: MipA/OmpV family protein [Marinagarivorans sp.]
MQLLKHVIFDGNWRHRLGFALAATIATIALCAARPTAAAETTCKGDCVAVGEWDFSLSVGAGTRTNPVMQQDDISFLLVPKFSYYGKRFFIDTYDVGYTLFDRDYHQFNAILITPGFEQTFFSDWALTNQDIGDTGEAHKLHNRRLAGLSGFEYSFIHPYFDWQTQVLQDVSGAHDGQKVRTALTVPWFKNNHAWQLSAGVTWQSDKLVDYYYGVRSNEVNNQDLVYQAPAATSTYLKAEWETRFNKHWGLRAVTSYKKLGSGVIDSPIVVDDHVFTIYAAGVYHF